MLKTCSDITLKIVVISVLGTVLINNGYTESAGSKEKFQKIDVRDCVRRSWKMGWGRICTVVSPDAYGLSVGAKPSESLSTLSTLLSDGTIKEIYLYNEDTGIISTNIDKSHLMPDLALYSGMLIDFTQDGRDGVLRYSLENGKIKAIKWESKYWDF